MASLRALVTCCIVIRLVLAQNQSHVPCSAHCTCFMDEEQRPAAKCRVKDGELSKMYLPNGIQNLDLSGNNLSDIPSLIFTRTPNVTQLSLANNRITSIKPNSFKDIASLQILSLSHNSLSYWEINLKQELGKLRILDVTGNMFIPDQRFLSLPMLSVIEGVSWSKTCQACLLVKSNVIDELPENQTFELCSLDQEDFDYHDEVSYGFSYFFVRNGFSPQCVCSSDQCEDSELNKPYDIQLNSIVRKLFYVEYLLGTVAIILNTIVVLTVVLSRPLHKPSFILISNVALCDLLMGIYTVLIGRFTVYEFIVNNDDYKAMDEFVNPYCTAMGFIFTTSQVVAVPTSLLVTVERYLSIVHCMDPAKRLRKKLTITLIACLWCCGVAYAVLPLFHVGGLTHHGEYTCMLPFVDGLDPIHFSNVTLAVAITLAVLYIVSLFFYLPVYRFVKNSNISTDLKRKAILAKNIAVMIATNFVFLILPLISTLIFVYSDSKFQVFLDVDNFKGLQLYYIFLSWLPVVLLSINSCLNPFLCAFRHPKFRSQLRALVKKAKSNILRKRNAENTNVVSAWRGCSVGGIDIALDTNKEIRQLSFINNISTSI